MTLIKHLAGLSRWNVEDALKIQGAFFSFYLMKTFRNNLVSSIVVFIVSVTLHRTHIKIEHISKGFIAYP